MKKEKKKKSRDTGIAWKPIWYAKCRITCANIFPEPGPNILIKGHFCQD